jgi:hypothetical protein
MAGVEHDDKALGKPHPKAAQSARYAGRSPISEWNDGLMEMLKETRDAVDLAVPKISSLSPLERMALSLRARSAGAQLESSISMSERPYDPKTMEPLKRTPDSRVQSLYSIGRVLGMDTSNMPPKQYEALVKQVWKVTKERLDKTLERPEVRQLLAPERSSRK